MEGSMDKKGINVADCNQKLGVLLFVLFATAAGVALLTVRHDVLIVVCGLVSIASFFAGMGSWRLPGDADYRGKKFTFRSVAGFRAMIGGGVAMVLIVFGCFIGLDIERERLKAEQAEIKKVEAYFADKHDHLCRKMTTDEAIAEFWK